MRLAGALAVLLLVAVVASLELWPSRPAPQPAIQRRAATPAATTPMRPVAPVVPAPTTDNQHSAAVPDAPGAFSRRLRCVDARTVYRGLASADVLALLCGGKPLDALQVEMPLAEAGDLHAVLFVAAFATEGPCGPVPSASFARHRANDIERAQASGAGPEALRRLDDVRGLDSIAAARIAAGRHVTRRRRRGSGPRPRAAGGAARSDAGATRLRLSAAPGAERRGLQIYCFSSIAPGCTK